MGKLRCERIVDNDPVCGVRVFVLPNGQNVRVTRKSGWWVSATTNRRYHNLEEIRALVVDFEKKWARRRKSGPTTRPMVGATLTGMGAEAQTVWLQDGWEEPRSEPRPKRRGQRADHSATTNYAVPLTCPHESRQKAASAAAARRMLAEHHGSDEHRSQGPCNVCR